jgi:hypothetical protein
MSKNQRLNLLDRLKEEDADLWNRIISSKLKAVDTAEIYSAVFNGTRKFLRESEINKSQLDTLLIIFRLSLEKPYLHRTDLGYPRYGTLDALIEKGMLTPTARSGGKKKLFRLTTKGHDEVMKLHYQWGEHLKEFQKKFSKTNHFWLRKSGTRSVCPHCGCQKITLDERTVYIDVLGTKYGAHPPKCLRTKK